MSTTPSTLNILELCEKKVLEGKKLSFEEAMSLSQLEGTEIFQLLTLTSKVKEKFIGKKVDLCSIVAGKTGECSENCKYCAQSAHHNADMETVNILASDEIIEKAKKAEQDGAHRFSIVNSGYGPSEQEFQRILTLYTRMREETSLGLCASLGVITEKMVEQLVNVGVTMYHHNIETAKSFYPEICTTHSYEDRVKTIEVVKKAGMNVCSGGIISMGESMEQRIEMAFELKELGVDSIPINILNPIKGTPLENQQVISPLEILKTIAIFRLVMPSTTLRFAGGRITALGDLQSLGFMAGINASLIGDYLTTYGRSTEDDLKMMRDLGLEV